MLLPIKRQRDRETGMSWRVPEGCPLSQRQYEVMTLLCEGLTQREIAEKLNYSRSTIRDEIIQARWALRVHNQRAAVAAFFENGWFHPQSTSGWRDYSNWRPAA
jgi:DNA-binding NarL/FixJ family response regulator